jgi:predicted alpha/beta-fold hydrolase
VPNFRDVHFPALVIHVADDPVITNAEASSWPTLELAALSRARIVGEIVYRLH